MGEKKNNKTLRIIGDAIFFTIIGVMVTFFVWNFVDIKSGYKYPIFGTRTSVIVSPSMATVNEANKSYITEDMKQIQKYDVITTKQYKSYEDIQIYDIATYYNGSKDLVCHRVIDKYEDNGIKYVVFRGDANNVDDAPVSYELVRGKVTNITPKMGQVVAFIQSPYFYLALFGSCFFIFLGMFIITRGKEKKAIEEKPQEKAQPEATEEAPKEEQPQEENQDVNTEQEQPVEEENNEKQE